MRKTACLILQEGKKSVTVGVKRIEEFLGKKIFKDEDNNRKDEVGVATGLAWTSFGGDTLSIEVNLMEGQATLNLPVSLAML